MPGELRRRRPPGLLAAILLLLAGLVVNPGPAQATSYNYTLGVFDPAAPQSNPYAGCVAAILVGNGFVFPTVQSLVNTLDSAWPTIPQSIGGTCFSAVNTLQPQVCLAPADRTVCNGIGAAEIAVWLKSVSQLAIWQLAGDGAGCCGGYAQVGLPAGSPQGTRVGSVSGTFTLPSYVCTSRLSCPAPNPGLYSDCGPFSCGPITWFNVDLTGRTPAIAGFASGEPAWGGYLKAVDGYGHVIYDSTGVYGNWYWGGGCGGPVPYECNLTNGFKWNCQDPSGRTGANCANQSLTVSFAPYVGYRDGAGDKPSPATLAQQVQIALTTDNLPWHPNAGVCGYPAYYNFGAPNDCLHWNDPRLTYNGPDGLPAVTWDGRATPPQAVLTLPSASVACLVGINVLKTPAATCPDASGSAQPILQSARTPLPFTNPPQMTLDVSGPTELSQARAGGYSPNPFNVVAHITNQGGGEAFGTVAVLALPAGLSLAPGEISQHDIGAIASGLNGYAVWRVVADRRSNTEPDPYGRFTYEVTASFQNAPALQQSLSVTVPADGFHPGINGYQFINPVDKAVTYAQAASYYPDSSFYLDLPFVGRVRNPVSQAFFDKDFAIAYGVGTCFGMATSATDLFNSQGRPVIWNSSNNWSLPWGSATFKSMVEEYHARQFGTRFAHDAVGTWYATGSIAGNRATFNSIRAKVASRPVVVTLAPSQYLFLWDTVRWQDLFNQVSHAVVAYAPDPSSPNRFLVYDPNVPYDGRSTNRAAIQLNADNGVQLFNDGNPVIGSGGLDGRATDWVLVPAQDASFARSGNTAWDAGLMLTFFTGAPDRVSKNLGPALIFRAGTPGAPQAWVAQSGYGLDASIRWDTTAPEIASIAGQRMAEERQLSGGTSSTHHVLVGPDASWIQLDSASVPESFSTALTGNRTDASRKMTVNSVALVPGSSFSLSSDPAFEAPTLASSGGADQTVMLSLQQIGAGAATVTVPALVPGSGSAAVSIYDWTALTTSLVYENLTTPAGESIRIAQDQPLQRRQLILTDLDAMSAQLNDVTARGIGHSLQVKLDHAAASARSGDYPAATRHLAAFQHELDAQTGKAVPAATAASLTHLRLVVDGLLAAG